MNLAALDLNLLVVFDALMQERNATRAGERIGLTQSAVSNALARLRALLKDELFLRTASGMRPTPRALDIAVPVRQALDQIRDALEPPRFDPATSEASFVLAAGDYIAATLLPPLMALIRERAPGVRLRLLPTNTLDIVQMLDAGACDMAIGLFDRIPERLDSMVLWEETVSLVARLDHPLASEPLQLDRLALASHVLVSQTGQEDGGASEGYLTNHGLRRQVVARAHLDLRQRLKACGLPVRIALTVPYFSVVPPILQHSDLVALLPRRVALAQQQSVGLAMQELPYTSAATPIQCLWHRRHAAKADQVWLRTLVFEAARR